MDGFCTECGQPLDGSANCSLGHSQVLITKVRFAPDPQTQAALVPAPSSVACDLVPAGAPRLGVGPLPKASTMRRLLGSGIEYLFYVMGIAVITLLSAVTGGFVGSFAFLSLVAMVGLRDVNAGTFSISKRIGCMRVVDVKTAQHPTNTQALIRNGYYLVLLLVMNLPYVEFIASFFFMLLILIDVLMIIASPAGRRIGDYLAGTQVVPEVRS